MKPSKFNIIGRSKEDPTKALLYNTLHDHRILFDDPQLDPEILFKKIRDKAPLNAREQEAVPDLKEIGVILEDDVDEHKIFEKWYQEKVRDRTDLMQFTILTTMACNLACDYCFENDVREDGILKEDTTEQIVSFIKKRIDRYGPKEIHFNFFGGEPLLNPKPIKKILKEIHPYALARGISTDVGMITNGVLLTPEFVDELTPYGFRWVKITFDGDKEEHDKKRIHHNRKGTFDKIYDNLAAIHGKIKIAIGGNFDNDNYESLFTLVDRLKASPFADDIMFARFKPIMQVNPDIASQRQGRITSFCDLCSYNSAQIKGMLDLQQKVLDSGISIMGRPEMGPCEYHMRHSFTIGPDGSLYRCPAFVGLRNLIAGHVGEDELNAQGEWQINSRKWEDDCEECHFLPSCAGGCHYSALNKTGSLEVKNCDGPFLEKQAEVFIEREIARISQEGVAAKEV